VTVKFLRISDVAKEANMSKAYATTILGNLAKEGYVLKFQLGKGRYKYYLLTEKGLALSETFTE